MSDNLDAVLETVARFYWVRPQHLAYRGRNRVLRTAQRVASYHGRECTAASYKAIADRLERSPTTVRSDHRQLVLTIRDGNTRQAIDARAVGMLLCGRLQRERAAG